MNTRAEKRSLLIVTTIPWTLTAFFLPFAEHFRKRGWRVDAASSDATGSAPCRAAFDRVWDIGWSRNPLDLRNFLFAARQIRRLAIRERYEIVHVHTPVASFVTRFALRRLRKRGRVKVIYSAHGYSFYEGGRPAQNIIFKCLEKLAGRWTDHLVITNVEDERTSRRMKLVASDRIHYIPGVGVDMARYSPDSVPEEEVIRVRREMKLRPDDKLFVMAAEFIPRKRHGDLLRALARLNRADVHVALPGEGPLLEEMRRLTSELELEDRAHYLGYRSDLPRLMRASIATILPSEREGLPRSVMESLSLEIPVIGTDIPGTRQLLEGGGGILVKVGDVEGLSASIAWMSDFPGKARAMGERGRACMAEYDIGRVIRMHEDLFAEALSTRQA
ncbi:MAG: glycosyltransferase family 4 protein [Acidobacteriota bacterium]|nr:glycosyltransferase family 4 protein [Acidobacteriota bacterium]